MTQTPNPEVSRSVFIVDDDPEIRQSLVSLLRSVGLDVKALASVPEFLNCPRPDGPTCLVLDVRLPGRSGLDLQRELSTANIQLPVIFITGHGDIPMSVKAMKGGAIEFLTKPFRDQDLLDAVELGLARDRERRDNDKELRTLSDRFETLTSRECEVMGHVVTGRLNKEIARGAKMRRRWVTSGPASKPYAPESVKLWSRSCAAGLANKSPQILASASPR